MTTSDHNAAALAHAAAEMQACGRAHPAADDQAWRMDALERAGELALDARFIESRRAAEGAR